MTLPERMPWPEFFAKYPTIEHAMVDGWSLKYYYGHPTGPDRSKLTIRSLDKFPKRFLFCSKGINRVNQLCNKRNALDMAVKGRA